MSTLTKVTLNILIMSIVILPQGVLHVPSQYPTIQSAIDVSNTGDTILVQPGTYIENVVINNIGDIILIGADGKEYTIIEGNYQSPTLFVDGSSYVEGFTLTKGNPGLAVGTEFPTLKNLVVRDNIGGGIKVNGNESALLEDIIVENNQNDIGDGGGIQITGGSAVLRNITIRNNTDSLNNGGGIYISGSQTNVHLNNVYIYSNYAKYGGGIYLRSGDVIIDSTYIINNESLEGGGVYFVNSGDYQMTNSLICNNKANGGGGLSGTDNFNISNTSICFNNAIVGSAIFGSCILENTTITDNVYNNNNPGVIRSSPELILSQSNIQNNTFALFVESSGSAAIGENNWWGDPSGPYHPSQNPQGQGDSVNFYVDITPFLSTPNLDAPPLPVQNLEIQSSTINSVLFSWSQSPLSDVIGYKIHFDTTNSNLFYSNTIDLGNVIEYELQNLQPDTKYFISVTCYDTEGNESWFCKSIGILNGNPLSVEVDNKLNDYTISQNFPNPFNPITTIQYQIPERSFVTLQVYDVLGNEVATLVSEEKPAGRYQVDWNAIVLPSGIYFYQLRAREFIETKKMILLK